ncbi:MAG: nucleotidyltransferase family protein, partial [Armatimonadota bacterium]|nr:nucleotidyltransferase family protein [Armatimonadota bacterium]
YVQLHWSLSGGTFRLHLDPWETPHATGHVHLAGRALPMLSPEVLLLYLCIHGGRHFWSRLAWIRDVAALLTADALWHASDSAAAGGTPPRLLDWERLARLATQHRCERAISLGLLLAAEILGAPLPTQAAARARADRTAVALTHWVSQRLFTSSRRGIRRLVSAFLYHLRLREHLLDGMGDLWFGLGERRSRSPQPEPRGR